MSDRSELWSELRHQLKREFFAGGTAGSIGIFIGFPLDVVKVKMQVFPEIYRSAWQCLRTSIAEEGLFGLYKGCLPPIATQGIINSLMFVGESLATRFLEPDLKPGEIGSVVNTLIAGTAGGMLQCTALVPAEVIKCSLQTQTMTPGQSEWQRTWNCVSNIVKTQGVFNGLYKGSLATFLREAPSIGLYFFSYKYTKEALTRWQGLKEANSLSICLSGGVAGALSWTVVYPFDVLKTHVQTQSSSLGAPLSLSAVARQLFQRHGVSVFFSGLGVTILRAFPVNASTFFCYEKLKHMMHLEHRKQNEEEYDGLFR